MGDVSIQIQDLLDSSVGISDFFPIKAKGLSSKPDDGSLNIKIQYKPTEPSPNTIVDNVNGAPEPSPNAVVDNVNGPSINGGKFRVSRKKL